MQRKKNLLKRKKKSQLAASEKFLASNNISNLQDITKLENDLFHKRNDLSKLPKNIVGIGEDPTVFMIDDFSKSLVENIIKLRFEVKNLRIQDYIDAKLESYPSF